MRNSRPSSGAILAALAFVAGACSTAPLTPAQQRTYAVWEKCKQPGMELQYVQPDGAFRYTYRPDFTGERARFNECVYDQGRRLTELEPGLPKRSTVSQQPATSQSKSPLPQGRMSELLKDAFFTTSPPEPGKVFRTDGSDLPAGVREFDAERDERVVFFYSIKQAYRQFRLRTYWHDPTGALFDTFSRTLDQTRSPTSTWFYTLNVVESSRIKEYPGTWTVEVLVDDQPAGKYSFNLISKSAAAPPGPSVKAERP